jgi:hypothetical protein
MKRRISQEPHDVTFHGTALFSRSYLYYHLCVSPLSFVVALILPRDYLSNMNNTLECGPVLPECSSALNLCS